VHNDIRIDRRLDKREETTPVEVACAATLAHFQGGAAMTNEFRTLTSHSAEYFGDTRDHWWNTDFLDLMGKRLSFDTVRDVLDVGCGVGHWGQLLASVLPGNAHVTGIDRDPLWVEKAATLAKINGLAERFSYQVSLSPKRFRLLMRASI
jgi:SAM-dependent methyltransferase